MKTRFIVVLLGMFGLFGSTVLLAHNPVYVDAYAGIPLTGGITIRGGSIGHTGYSGHVSLGFTGGYANYGYAGIPYYSHVHGPYCGHSSYTSYRHSYRHDRRNRHHNRHHHNDRHGRHH